MKRPPLALPIAVLLSALLVVSTVVPAGAVGVDDVGLLEPEADADAAPNVTVSALETSGEIQLDESYNVTANVTNHGANATNVTAAYRIEGTTVDNTTVELNGTETRPATIAATLSGVDVADLVGGPLLSAENVTHGIYVGTVNATSNLSTAALTGTIEGNVTDAATGNPVANATVALGNESGAAVETAGNGTYRIENVSAGSRTLNVTARGYLRNESVEVPVTGETDAPDVELGSEGANFTVSSFDPVEFAAPNLTLLPRATVTNVGEGAANQTVEYRFDNTSLDSTALQLEPGANATVALHPVLPEDIEAGNYTHGIVTSQHESTETIEIRTETGALEGWVLDDSVDNPREVVNKLRNGDHVEDAGFVSGANVTVEGTDLDPTVSDQNGSFFFDRVPAPAYPAKEDYTVSVEHGAYQTATVQLPLSAGFRNQTHVLLAPERTGNVTGWVENADGTLSGVNVTLADDAGKVTNVTQTGTEGTYDFEDVAVGDYTVVANASGYVANESEIEVHHDETTTENVSLTPLPVEVTIDDFPEATTALPGETVSVSANVTNEGDRPAVLNVSYWFRNATEVNESVELTSGVKDDVSFNYTVPKNATPGNYTHGVYSGNDNASGEISILEPANVTIEQLTTTDLVGGDLLNVTATLNNSGDVETNETVTLAVNETGIVADKTVTVGAGQQSNVTLTWNTTTDDTGEYNVTVAAESVTETTAVEVHQAAGTLIVNPTAPDNSTIQDATVRVFESGTEIANTSTLDEDDGNYQLEVPVGDGYDVQVTPRNYKYADGTSGQVSKDGKLLVLTNHQPRSGSIDGVVTSNATGAELADVEVTLSGGTQNQDTDTDSDGSYEFDEVEPGEYELVFDPADYEQTTSLVTVGPNQDVTRNVSVEPLPATIHGRIRNSTDRSFVEGATVELQGDKIRSTVTDEHGRYEFEDVPAPAEYTLGVNTSGYIPKDHLSEKLDPNEDLTNDVSLKPSPEEATYSLTDLHLPQSVVENESYEVRANVTNAGEERGNQTVSYLRNGDTVTESALDLEGGVTGQIVFEVNASEVAAPGNHTHGFSTPYHEIADNLLVLPQGGWTIEGNVTDSTTDTPVENTTVSIDAEGLEPVQTDENGSYAISGVPLPENYTISVSGAEYHENETKKVDVKFGSSPVADVALERRQTYAGVDWIDAPGSVDEGTTVDVTANVTNYGTTALDNETVELVADGSIVANATVDLNETGASETVGFTYDAGSSGSRTLAIQTRNDTASRTLTVEDGSDDSGGGGGFGGGGGIDPSPGGISDSDEPDLSVLSADASELSIVPGGTIRVDVTVQNRGDAEGSIDLELTADGETVDTETVTVPAGSNVGTTLSGSVEEAGSYDLVVEGESAGTLEVEDGEADDGSDDTEFDDEEVVGGNSSDDGQPGFGIAAALAALVLGVGYVAGRSRAGRQ